MTLARYTTLLLVLYAAPIISQECSPKAATAGQDTVWEITDRIQAVVGGATNPALVGNSRVISQSLIPYQITESGRYKLCEDLTSSALDPYAIQITTSYVYLDCNGHTITKDAPAGTVQRSVISVSGADGITIANGMIAIALGQANAAATVNAISLSSCNDCIVRNMYISGVDTDFFQLPGGYTENGVLITNCDGIKVSDVDMRLLDDGVSCNNSGHIHLKSCIFNAPRDAGPFLQNSHSLLVQNCSSQTGRTNYRLVTCTNALFTECVGDASGQNAFDIFQGTAVYFVRCCAQRSSQESAFFSSFAFYNGSLSCGAIDCTAMSGSGPFGFFVADDSSAVIYRCTAADNDNGAGTAVGFRAPSGAAPADCYFANNLSDQNTGAGDFVNVDSRLVKTSADIDSGTIQDRPRFWHNVDR